MLIFAILAWVLTHYFPSNSQLGTASGLLAIFLFVFGITIAALAAREFKKAKTTINPLKLDAASSLVISGPFSWTRNPMYLGLTFVLFAWCLFLANAIGFLVMPLFALYITRFQIRPEERVMRALFEKEFEQYCQRVPRWL